MKISGICSEHGYYKGDKCPECKKVDRSDESKKRRVPKGNYITKDTK